MNHQPTQLALLISLIGVGLGVSPCANASARLEDREAGALQSLPEVTCDELEAATVQTCAGPADLVWQPTRSALGWPVNASVGQLDTAPRDDWAPGETLGQAAAVDQSPGHWVPRQRADMPRPTSVQAAAKPSGAREPLRSTSRKQATAKARNVRVIPEAPRAARGNAQPLARADLVIERLEQIEQIEQAEPLLAAPVAAAPRAIEVPAAGRNEASRPQADAHALDASPAQAERPVIAAETQASMVLRNLGAILSEERDEVGAIRPDAPAGTGTSQTGKVLAMLAEITAAQPVVEDGPARRLRKLAARAVKAEADVAVDHSVAADVATAAAPPAASASEAADWVAEFAQNGVDLMLPLEAPVTAAPQPTDVVALRPLVESLPVATQPVDSEPPTVQPLARQARANPFGERQVAVSENALDRVRGGFSGDGLNISFGIERAVYVNGALVTTTSLNVSDLGRVSAGRGTASYDIGSMGLVQSGAGNVVAPVNMSAGAISTVVQNTLDGQKIQNVTVINATVNSLGVLRGLNLQSSLRGAVIDSLRR